MVSKEEAKEKIKELVKEFSEYSKEELDKKSEIQIQYEFIDELFKALGWDMRKDVEREERVLKKRADYIFRIGNQEKLVVEAKKTNVHLLEEQGRQAVSYAYHRKIKFSVLTNFKYIRVYHALSNIKNIDKNLLKKDGAYFILEAKEFLDKFDLLWLLSKESFEKEEINKLLSTKDERLAKPIDESILIDLLEIRELLSKDLKKLRNYLGDEKIDEAIQILINRFIFMRSVEDRGLENKNFLLGIRKDFRGGRLRKRLWDALEIQFKIFNKMYNSKLFAPSILEDEKDIFFDDDTLDKIIWILYFGTKGQQARYMFDQIPSDLLGSIYEQYLGTILRGTEKRVRLESGTGKRKKMGIYYTPSYIVDYIVKNTVGEYIKDKTIDEILEVKIVDPACGSGSFLIMAFQEICNVIEEKLKNKEKARKYKHTFQEWKGKLSLGEKATILTNCIYGVDLDEKAIELTELNLLLKILEEEGRDIPNKRLPNLFNNIKCGNSLIDDSKVAGDKAFNWKAQFPDVFSDGGFDVVIGNPPYIRVELLNHKEADYLKSRYNTVYQRCDIYVSFIERANELLKEGGYLGFINPNQFIVTEYGVKLREFLIDKRFIYKIIDFGDEQVFEGISTYTLILIANKSYKENFEYRKINNLNSLLNLDEQGNSLLINFSSLKDSPVWNLQSEIITKIKENSEPLSKIAHIKSPLTTGLDSLLYVSLIGEKENCYEVVNNNQKILLEKDLWKKIIRPKQIRPWLSFKPKLLVFFPYENKSNKFVLIEEKRFKKIYPKTYSFLSKHKKSLENRKDSRKTWKELGRQWYSLHRVGKPEDFYLDKILINSIINKKTFCLDLNKNLYPHGGIFGIISKKINLFYLLGLLNSNLIFHFIKKTASPKRGGYVSLNINILGQVPIKLPTSKQEKKMIDLVDQMLELQKKFHDKKVSGHEKERLEQQIKNVDYEIDQEIYKLYGLTPEEIKIVEEGLM